ncbi:MAG: Uma2 family endonuclease [Hydrogenothermus sp.]|nr:MAG: Uma2 family endonuclease [Hydrogenothermus sp.]
MATLTKIKKTTKKKKQIPKELVYELINGSPVYYRDYEKVLSGQTTLEGVMGSSDLQSWIILTIVEFLLLNLDKEKYKVLSNELGYIPKQRTRYNLDIAIIDRNKIKKLTGKYLKIPPEVVIEVDTKADLKKFENPQDYFHRKTQDLLDSGIKKVVWIFTKEKKIWIAEKGKRWIITDWDDEINIFDDINFNLKKLLDKENIKY